MTKISLILQGGLRQRGGLDRGFYGNTKIYIVFVVAF